MTDDAPGRRTDRSFALLASSLDVADEKPDLDPMMTLVDAAYHAVQYALEESQGVPDHQTTTAVSLAQRLFIWITEQGRAADPYSNEVLAAQSLELSLLALRRSLEIKAGLCQPLTEKQWNRRVAAAHDSSRLGKADRSRRKGWIAALRAWLPWKPPEDPWHNARVKVVNDQFDLALDWLKVPDEIRRRFDSGREDVRKREMRPPGADLPNL